MENYNGLIEVDLKKMMGKPCIRGTRITVELILEKLAAGESVETILDQHPVLTVASIQAALQFAADNLSATHIYPVAS